jgi:hypothetical protein
LYVADRDGSHPTRLFAGQPLADALTLPSYSPDGAYVARAGGEMPDSATGDLLQPLAGGVPINLPSTYRFFGWGDGGRVLLLLSTTLGPYATYAVGNGAITPLAPSTHDYVWAS